MSIVIDKSMYKNFSCKLGKKNKITKVIGNQYIIDTSSKTDYEEGKKEGAPLAINGSNDYRESHAHYTEFALFDWSADTYLRQEMIDRTITYYFTVTGKTITNINNIYATYTLFYNKYEKTQTLITSSNYQNSKYSNIFKQIKADENRPDSSRNEDGTYKDYDDSTNTAMPRGLSADYYSSDTSKTIGYLYPLYSVAHECKVQYDPAFPETKKYIKDHMRKWCEENRDTDVVRFTTFLYQFTLMFNPKGNFKHVEWFGYGQTANPVHIENFYKETGIRLTAEDFVDNGYYNNQFRNPTEKLKKYMDFIERFVAKTVRELVDICHEYGKEAMMFLGDDWIGSEPYGEHFKDMGLDAVVGSVGGGVTVRMLSEIPHVKYHEGRFLPYFFPDTFFDGNEKNALAELNKNWLTARRAHMRKPLDRMGFGGYLSLAAKFPEFIDRVEEIADEFRTIYDAIDNKKPYCRLKVAILNGWGKKRSWMSHMVSHEDWYQSIYSYQGVLEIISGLPVDIEFLSFDDVKSGVPNDIDIVINVGDAYTSFSGGTEWLDEKLQTSIRKFVYNGGGFIGVGEPTACEANGRFFQLADVLGVDEEIGFSLSEAKHNICKVEHELTKDLGYVDYGEDKKNVYALEGTKVLDIAISGRFKRNFNVGEVKMAVNEYGKGRSFYITGIPYGFENARLLYKAMCFVAHKDINVCYSTNVNTECNYYPTSKRYAIVNNGKEEQTTDFYDIDGNKETLTLKPMEIKWIEK